MKQKVVVLCGGQSNEHLVSRMSATTVVKNLNRQKYDVDVVGIDTDGSWHLLDSEQSELTQEHWLRGSRKINDIFGFLQAHDVAFPVLHGKFGEDGTIQGLFACAGIPHVGCGVLCSSVSMDKVYTKKIIGHTGIPQVKYAYVKMLRDGTLQMVDAEFQPVSDPKAYVMKTLGFPCFVKASRSGSSVGCFRCEKKDDLLPCIRRATEYDDHIIIEQAVNCIELEVAVLGNENLTVSRVGQILPHGEFYSYTSKYDDEESGVLIPAAIDAATEAQIRCYAARIFQILDGRGLARVDFFMDRDTGAIYFNEVNTLPGFTDISMYPKLFEEMGVSCAELLNRLIALALE